jgi:tRNA threonylcarbamoyladenosine biosynthesis protein TsaB
LRGRKCNIHGQKNVSKGNNLHEAKSSHKSLYSKKKQYIIQLLPLSMTMPLNAALKILALDTASPRGSIALLQGNDVFAELRLRSLQTHSITLMRSVDFLLGRLGWTLHDLNLVAVGTGPGSFTGIRIGIATALGIAQSLSIPFAGVNGLEALAHQVSSLSGRIGICLNAQRSQVYYAEYVGKNGRVRPAKKPSLFNLSDLEHYLAGRHLYMVGDIYACPADVSRDSGLNWARSADVDLYLAASIGRTALLRKRRWQSKEFVSCDPLYIRPPDALRKKNRPN